MTWVKRFGITLVSGLLSFSVLAQKPAEHFHPPAQGNQPKNANPQNKGGQQPGPKMGEWLNAHKNLPPDQQQKLLENDPSFKRLSPQRQAEIKERLHKFNSLPPQQQDRILNRMQFMASLSPEQRQQIRKSNETLQTLPQDRQVMVHKALRHLRQMNPQEREQVMNSERFKSTFSEQEQGILKELSAISPPEGSAQPQPNGQPR
ncbi:MAG TPA: DUF3106 domain-containing protein [Candidatus Angelobacter sp.]